MGFNPWAIRDVGDGNVGWIQGRITGTPPLVAPLSKRPCFYSSVLVPGQGEQVQSAAELTIEDDTGRAIVVLRGARFQLDYDFTVAAPDLEELGVVDAGAVSRREGILGLGELVAVYGHCSWERDPDPSRPRLYRDPLPMRLRINRTSQVKVWVSEDVPERT